MQLSDAVEITTVGTVKAANEHLDQGWKLLAVSAKGKDGDVHPCYVLGLPKKAAGHIPAVGAVQMDVHD